MEEVPRPEAPAVEAEAKRPFYGLSRLELRKAVLDEGPVRPSAALG